MWEREERAKSPCLSLTLEETKTINKGEDFCNYFAQKILEQFGTAFESKKGPFLLLLL